MKLSKSDEIAVYTVEHREELTEQYKELCDAIDNARELFQKEIAEAVSKKSRLGIDLADTRETIIVGGIPIRAYYTTSPCGFHHTLSVDTGGNIQLPKRFCVISLSTQQDGRGYRRASIGNNYAGQRVIWLKDLSAGPVVWYEVPKKGREGLRWAVDAGLAWVISRKTPSSKGKLG